ncbi:MAG: efflux RND transporter permease subunit [Candidatus Eisenbacteria bacterium]|nr:efflux RND transporter permease subunit [Candidatus Eisenbacteria bacterium]
MKLVEGAMTRPVTVVMLTTAAVVFGLVSLGRLPQNLLPDISYPTLTVRTEYPDAAPAEVEKLVTEPLEESVSVVRGLRGLRSSSRSGASEIVLEFGWKTDMDYASLDVREKIDTVRLPDDAAAPVLLRYDPTLDPVLRIGLSGGTDPVTLREIADRIVKKDLESLLGVASVRIQGGLEEEIQVEVDEGKIAKLGVPISTVGQFLAQQNLNAAGGRLRDRDSEFLVRTLNEFDDLGDLGETVLYEEDGRRIALQDVATIQRGFKERDVITRVAGKESVELAVYKEGDANTVQVAKAVRSRLDVLQSRLPDDIDAAVLSDQSVFIEQSVNEVRSNAIVGGILAVLVLFLFLKQRKPTAIVGVTIPISILATFFVMQQLGVSLNIMSLGGLALGVGMLVDNAIVVLEAIHRHRLDGKDVWTATRDGASEVSRAVVASTLTTVAVFLPIVFVEGIAGQIFRDQALTVTASLVVSLIAALTLIPMLSAIGARPDAMPALTGDSSGSPGSAAPVGVGASADVSASVPSGAPVAAGRTARVRRVFRPVLRGLAFVPRWIGRIVFVLLPGGLLFVLRKVSGFLTWAFSRLLGPVGRGFDLIWDRVDVAYPNLLTRAVRRPGWTLTWALVPIVAAVLLFPRLGVDLVPQFVQGRFSFELELPPGTPLWKMESAVHDLEETLAQDDRIGLFYTTIGESSDLGSGASERRENVARLDVSITHLDDPAEEEAVVASIRDHLEKETEFRHTFSRPSYFSFRTPVEVHVFGYDLADLQTYGDELVSELSRVPGFEDVRSSVEDGSPELQVVFDRERMASFDLDLATVSQTLRNKIRGDVATRYKERDKQLDILVRTADARTLDISQVDGLLISQVDGIPVPLSTVADVQIGRGPSEITRIDQQRAAVIRANLSGRDLGSATRAIESVVAKNPPPSSLAVSLSGQNDEVRDSYKSLVLAVALAIFMVYMVMASQFESFLHPLVILLTVPLGMVGVIFSLAVTGTSISVVVLIGVVMLTGIVVNNAIVLVDFINQRRRQGLEKLEAIRDAARARLRPILMTTTTTVLGLLPMALGLGEGAEIRAPMAVAVIGGLLFATVLTLFLIPTVYAAVDRGA